MIKYFKKIGKIGVMIFVGVFFAMPMFARAESDFQSQFFSYNLDENTLAKGYTFSFFENNLQVIFKPKNFTKPVGLQVNNEDPTNFSLAPNYEKLSDIYRLKIMADEESSFGLPVIFNFQEKLDGNCQIYNFDDELGWQKIAKSEVKNKKAKFELSDKEMIVAVLRDNNIMTIGAASWYKYKNCQCAASPDYPKGSKLKVKDLDTGKEIIVKVNDYGPDRKIFPDRVIDLDATAFKKLAKLSRGIIKRVEVLLIENQK